MISMFKGSTGKSRQHKRTDGECKKNYMKESKRNVTNQICLFTDSSVTGMAEEIISELEHKSIETFQTEMQREK